VFPLDFTHNFTQTFNLVEFNQIVEKKKTFLFEWTKALVAARSSSLRVRFYQHIFVSFVENETNCSRSELRRCFQPWQEHRHAALFSMFLNGVDWASLFHPMIRSIKSRHVSGP